MASVEPGGGLTLPPLGVSACAGAASAGAGAGAGAGGSTPVTPVLVNFGAGLQLPGATVATASASGRPPVPTTGALRLRGVGSTEGDMVIR